MVIGSKLIDGASDERPWARHAASMFYTGLLRTLLGFRGTDTHGLKAFRRSALIEHVEACVVEKDVFASEFVIRAYRAGVHIREIPVRVMEKRPPSINLFKRVPNVLKSVAKLTWAIRVKAALRFESLAGQASVRMHGNAPGDKPAESRGISESLTVLGCRPFVR